MTLKELYELKENYNKAEKLFKEARQKFLEVVPKNTDTNYEYLDGEYKVVISKVEYEPDIDLERLHEVDREVYDKITKVKIVLDEEKLAELEYDPAVLTAVQQCLIPKEPGRRMTIARIK